MDKIESSRRAAIARLAGLWDEGYKKAFIGWDGDRYHAFADKKHLADAVQINGLVTVCNEDGTRIGPVLDPADGSIFSRDVI